MSDSTQEKADEWPTRRQVIARYGFNPEGGIDPDDVVDALRDAAARPREVWVIVKESSVYGREKGSALALATTEMYDSGPPHPAFTSGAEAREYLASLPHNWGLTPMRLELRGGIGKRGDDGDCF